MCAEEGCQTTVLRRATDGHEGKMTTAGLELDSEFELDARLALKEHPRLGAGRCARPTDSRLEARLARSRADG